MYVGPTLPTRRNVVAGLSGVAACGLNWNAQARDSNAQRIVAADWGAAECLLAVGLVPMAVPDITVYRQWLPEIQLPPQVIDLGSRTEPNFELLATLKPDRIFVSNWQRSLLTQFNRIAPTKTVTIVDARRAAYQNIRDALIQVATPVGRREVAANYLKDFDDTIATLAKSLAHIDHPPVYVGVLHENGSQIFVYGDGSWVHDILLRLGLRNALKRPTSAFGNALLDLAQLAETPDATLLYLDQGSRTRRAERILRTSTLWQNLPMVRQASVRTIPPFYALGGVPSAKRCARLIAAARLDAPRASDG